MIGFYFRNRWIGENLICIVATMIVIVIGTAFLLHQNSIDQMRQQGMVRTNALREKAELEELEKLELRTAEKEREIATLRERLQRAEEAVGGVLK